MIEKQSLRIRAADLEAENKKLKEVLKMCNPCTRRGLCLLCVLGDWEHADDCEYMRLTGG